MPIENYPNISFDAVRESSPLRQEIARLTAELAAANERAETLQRERDEMAAALEAIRAIVAPGAYAGLDYSGHVARIKQLLITLDPSTILAARDEAQRRAGAVAMVGLMEVNELIDQDQIEAGELVDLIESGEVEV